MIQTLIQFVPPTETIVIEVGGVEIEINPSDDKSSSINSFNYEGYNTADNAFVSASIDQLPLASLAPVGAEGSLLTATVEE